MHVVRKALLSTHYKALFGMEYPALLITCEGLLAKFQNLVRQQLQSSLYVSREGDTSDCNSCDK